MLDAKRFGDLTDGFSSYTAATGGLTAPLDASQQAISVWYGRVVFH